jgi:antitoxin component YwqK of YwqJK toxin-antitoxin module
MRYVKFLSIILFFTFFGCKEKDVYYNFESHFFEDNKGVLYYKGTPFNGSLIRNNYFFDKDETYEENRKYISYKVTYKDGLKNGLQEYYNHENEEGNSMISERVFNKTIEPGKTFLDGDYEEYFPNGEIKIKGEYTNGITTGDWYTYHENRKLKEINFRGSKESRRWRIEKYSENEVLTSIESFYNILENGEDYVRDGEWLESEEFINKKTGLNDSYQVKGNFKMGKKDGKWLESGLIEVGPNKIQQVITGTITYQDGIQNGLYDVKFRGMYEDDPIKDKLYFKGNMNNGGVSFPYLRFIDSSIPYIGENDTGLYRYFEDENSERIVPPTVSELIEKYRFE